MLSSLPSKATPLTPTSRYEALRLPSRDFRLGRRNFSNTFGDKLPLEIRRSRTYIPRMPDSRREHRHRRVHRTSLELLAHLELNKRARQTAASSSSGSTKEKLGRNAAKRRPECCILDWFSREMAFLRGNSIENCAPCSPPCGRIRTCSSAAILLWKRTRGWLSPRHETANATSCF